MLGELGNENVDTISVYFMVTLGIIEGQWKCHEMTLPLLSRKIGTFPSSDTSEDFFISDVSPGASVIYNPKRPT